MWTPEVYPEETEHHQQLYITQHRNVQGTNCDIPRSEVAVQFMMEWNYRLHYRESCQQTWVYPSLNSIKSPHLREKAYKQLIRPILEYACAVWDAALPKTQSSQLEAVQRWAAQTVNIIKRTDHTTSTTKLIKDMEWDELKDRREKCRLSIFRAMHFNEVATEISDYIAPYQQTSLHTRRHTQQYQTPHCRTKAHQNSFFISTEKLWNSLPLTSFLLVGPPVAG